MLGIIRAKSRWNWSACGKHPTAGDYFRIGLNDPVLRAFYGWVEKGYQSLGIDKNTVGKNRGFYSWRFWAKSPKKGNFVCGIGKDSSDRLGRPFPLLIAGIGNLPKLEKNWDLLPFACEKTWNSLEYLANCRFADIKQMENEIPGIKSPYTDWGEMKKQVEISMRNNHFSISDDLTKNYIRELHVNLETIIPMGLGMSDDPLVSTIKWHSAIKNENKKIPNGVFMGGGQNGNYLAVFNRPLMQDDFVKLWSV